MDVFDVSVAGKDSTDRVLENQEALIVPLRLNLNAKVAPFAGRVVLHVHTQNPTP